MNITFSAMGKQNVQAKGLLRQSLIKTHFEAEANGDHEIGYLDLKSRKTNLLLSSECLAALTGE